MTMPTAPFGRTGHLSSRVLFGAAALWRMPQERADALLDQALAAGVNHVDTAASYGASEDLLNAWLGRHRAEVFLATKTDQRTGKEARAQLERSLERLGVDHVDLIQLHNLVEPDEWEVAHGPGGAVEALARARDEGLVRFIGVTGHGLRIAGMHLRSLERFPFDSVLLPLSYVLWQIEPYRRDVEQLLAVCAERQVAVQTIKAIARARWRDDSTEPHFSWYEPLDDEAAIGRAIGWVLGHDGVFVNSTSDVRRLQATFDAARAFRAAPTDEEMAADVERFGMTPLFDGGALERI